MPFEACIDKKTSQFVQDRIKFSANDSEFSSFYQQIFSDLGNSQFDTVFQN